MASIGKYHPLFLEELFIVNLYGTEEEIEQFNKLLDSKDSIENIVAMATLLEDIKRKRLTKMNWFCCHRCQNYEICRINWFRGERNISRHCCSYCQNFDECYKCFLDNEKKKNK